MMGGCLGRAAGEERGEMGEGRGVCGGDRGAGQCDGQGSGKEGETGRHDESWREEWGDRGGVRRG